MSPGGKHPRNGLGRGRGVKVALTFDLQDDYLAKGFTAEEVAELDTEETIAGIQAALTDLGYETERIGGCQALVRRLAAGAHPDIVFNICEGLYGAGREAQVPALLDAYRIPYTFSDAAVLAVALHKGLTKRIVRDLGVPTPDFAIVEAVDEIPGVSLPFPLFTKPIAEGTGKGVSGSSRIADRDALDRVCR